jgi:hypothetical protein
MSHELRAGSSQLKALFYAKKLSKNRLAQSSEK